jgi:uncharacterized protein involved in type VI secretion and phage assembly
VDRFLTVHKFGDADAEGLGLKLRAMKGRESLSELFHFSLFADLPQDKVSELAADEILGKRVVFSLQQAESSPVFFSGIMSTMSLGNVSKEHRRSCNFEVVPELWKLTETLDTRRHPSNKVAQLVVDMLEERKLDLKLVDLISTNDKRHPARVNPVQYEESYYDFLVRHMQEEGIYFYHRERYSVDNGELQGQQTLVLGDDARGFYAEDPALELRFQLMENLSGVYDVRTWDRQFNFRPAKWTINDFDYQKASDFAMTREFDSGEKPFRKFKAHAGFYDKDYADQILANLAESEDVGREYVLATSNCPFLSPGCRFNLKGHPVKSENGEYIVTSVEHRAFEDLYGSGAEAEYENRFTCVPAKRVPTLCPHTGGNASANWPQPQPAGRSAGAAYDSSTFADFENISTARNTVSATAGTLLAGGVVAESAWVVDAAGKHDDPATVGTVHARQNENGAPRGIAEVLIKYTWETVSNEALKSAWQAPAPGGAATRWVRVAQLAAGKDWGTKFIPRVGEEVVILYLDGEKKKPVIMGSLFNSTSNTTNMNDRTTETVNIVSGQGGSPSTAFSREKPYGVADDPGKHELVEGISAVKRAVPNLKDDDVSGFRTRSGSVSDNQSGEGEEGKRFNEILFKDTKDQEELYMHAARDMNIDVEKDMHIVVHGDVHEIVHGKYYRSVNTDHADGPVNRSVVAGTAFDLDKVWEYKSIERTEHPYLVKTEVYADTETSARGDVKEVQWGTTDSYFLGNKWEMNISAAESLTLGFAMDIFVGGKMEFCAAISMTMCMAGLIEITGPSMKLEVNLGQQVNKTKTSANLVDVGINKSYLDVYNGQIRLSKDQLHIIKADVIVLDANLIVLDAKQIIQKTDSTNFLT